MRSRRLMLCAALFAWTLSALANPRAFPPDAQRGIMTAGADYTQIVLDGQIRRLSPGAKIKNRQNTIIMPSSLMNRVFTVNYTVDNQGYVDKVWILTNEELNQNVPQNQQ